MQYYERPRNCSLDSVMKSIDALCKVMDEILEFRLLGGESMLNKDWPLIVERLLASRRSSGSSSTPTARYSAGEDHSLSEERQDAGRHHGLRRFVEEDRAS